MEWRPIRARRALADQSRRPSEADVTATEARCRRHEPRPTASPTTPCGGASPSAPGRRSPRADSERWDSALGIQRDELDGVVLVVLRHADRAVGIGLTLDSRRKIKPVDGIGPVVQGSTCRARRRSGWSRAGCGASRLPRSRRRSSRFR